MRAWVGGIYIVQTNKKSALVRVRGWEDKAKGILTPFFAMRSVPNCVWFFASVTPVASQPKFFAAYATSVPQPQPMSRSLQWGVSMRGTCIDACMHACMNRKDALVRGLEVELVADDG